MIFAKKLKIFNNLSQEFKGYFVREQGMHIFLGQGFSFLTIIFAKNEKHSYICVRIVKKEERSPPFFVG